MNVRASGLFAVVLLILRCWSPHPLTAQAPPEPPTGVFGEVLEVRLVNVEVVVTDRKGVPVFGLGADDFTLLVDDEPAEIEYFTEIRGGLALATATDGGGERVSGVPGLAPGEPVATSYLLFIDDFFTHTVDRNRALRFIEESLSELIPEDRMAIVAFDGEQLEMLSSWSASDRELKWALRRAQERPAYGQRRDAEIRQLDRDASETLELSFTSELDGVERHFLEQLYEQLERATSAVAATLRGFAQPPGRKVMLILSGGWPLSPGDYVVATPERQILEIDRGRERKLMERVTDTANLLGYTLFPVDVPGLSVQLEDTSVFEERLVVPLDREVGSKGAVGRKSLLRENQLHASLQLLAGETGGRALLDEERARPLQTVKESTRSYYWLGFSPEREWDDRRHRLQVLVENADLRLSSRSSFLDSSRASSAGMAVESTLLFGSPAGEEGLRLEIGEIERAPKRQMLVQLIVWIPLGILESIAADDRQVTQMELRIAASDESGEQTDIPPIPLAFGSEEALTVGKYVRFETSLRLRRESHRLVAAVYDPLSGQLLSATIDLEP